MQRVLVLVALCGCLSSCSEPRNPASDVIYSFVAQSRSKLAADILLASPFGTESLLQAYQAHISGSHTSPTPPTPPSSRSTASASPPSPHKPHYRKLVRDRLQPMRAAGGIQQEAIERALGLQTIEWNSHYQIVGGVVYLIGGLPHFVNHHHRKRIKQVL